MKAEAQEKAERKLDLSIGGEHDIADGSECVFPGLLHIVGPGIASQLFESAFRSG